jgi:large subunit ribosomal protein L3
MSLGLIGKKLGMTKVYTDKGEAVAVTVVDVSGNTNHPGQAQRWQRQVHRRAGRLRRPEGIPCHEAIAGPLQEARLARQPRSIVKEFRLTGDDKLPAADAKLDASLFTNGQIVDVIGTTKGKGFQGVVKRWNFAGQPAVPRFT